MPVFESFFTIKSVGAFRFTIGALIVVLYSGRGLQGFEDNVLPTTVSTGYQNGKSLSSFAGDSSIRSSITSV